MPKQLLYALVALVVLTGLSAAIFVLTQDKDDDIEDSTSSNGVTTNSNSSTSKSTSASPPVFERENNTIFSDTELNNLEVITLPDGRYRMFMHDKNQLYSAISNDGKIFTREEGVRLQGQMSATVTLPDGSYRMYYSAGPNGGIKSAKSTDGFTFTVEDGVRLSSGAKGSRDADGMVHPTVIQLSDGSYRMYYDGVSPSGEDFPNWRIMSARSTDGLTWTKDAGVRIPVDEGEVDTAERYKFEMAFSAHAEYKDGQFILYFTSQGEPLSKSGIWRAVSTDGLKFTVDAAPVLARDPKYGDKDDNNRGGPKGMPQDPFILKTAHGERMFYWTADGGYATAFRDM